MCGLAGVMMDKLLLSDYIKFKDLFTLAQLRGDDGAGMFAVPKKDTVENISTRKTTWSSGHLVTTKDFEDCIAGDNSIVVGHARQPTKGGSELKNVHPHVINNEFYLVHNGTMHWVGGESIGQGESDSKKIAKCIYEKGVEFFVNNSSGAYCLIWADLRDQTLNFLRNKERPLFFLETRPTAASENCTGLWWSSEQWMVLTALSRYASYNKDAVRTYSLPVDEHWAFPLSVSWPIKAPVKTERKKPVSTTTPYQYGGGFFMGDDQEWDAYMSRHNGGNSTAVVPFQGSNSASTSASSRSNSGSSLGTSVNKELFSYTPPEHRGGSKTVSSSFTPAVLSPGRVFENSKTNADLATASRISKQVAEKEKREGTFPGTDKLAPFRVHNKGRVAELLAASCCVWCGEVPTPKAGEEFPIIYPIKFTTATTDYVCESCIPDHDVQRMVGVG